MFRSQTISPSNLGLGMLNAVDQQSASKKNADRITAGGIALAILALMVAMSGFKSLRVEVGGLATHAYLVPMTPLFLIVLVQRLRNFPAKILIPQLLFAGFFSLTCLPGGAEGVSEIVKLGSGVATTITAALLVRSTKDFRLGATALLAAAVVMCVHGFLRRSQSMIGVNGLEGGNENAFSLYTLPPLLLAGFIAGDNQRAKLLRIVLCVGILIVIVTMFSNANRSGWACAVLIAVMLLKSGGRLQSLAFVVIMACAAIGAVIQFGDVKLLKFRFNESFGKHNTDQKRVDLFVSCIQAGLENPIGGAGPTELKFVITRKVNAATLMDAHNVYGYIIGGSGLISSAFFFWWLWSLIAPPKSQMRSSTSKAIRQQITPHRLLRMMVVLWVVRGFFSREILYAPSFCIGLGIVIGLCIVNGVWDRKAVPSGNRIAPQLSWN